MEPAPVSRPHTQLPITLHKLMAREPAFFVQLLCILYKPDTTDDPATPDDATKEKATKAWHLLHDWSRIPGTQNDGSVSVGNWASGLRMCDTWRRRKPGLRSVTSRWGNYSLCLRLSGTGHGHAQQSVRSSKKPTRSSLSAGLPSGCTTSEARFQNQYVRAAPKSVSLRHDSEGSPMCPSPPFPKLPRC